MNNTTQMPTSPTDNTSSPSDDRKQSPPAFLDLADSVCTLSFIYLLLTDVMGFLGSEIGE